MRVVEVDAITDMAETTCNSNFTITKHREIVVIKEDRTTKVATIISMRISEALVDHSRKWAVQVVRIKVR